MNDMLKEYKTTIVGAIVIVLGLLESVLGIEIPGFKMDPGAAFATGLGLILAKDASSKN